jgi:hypothetical protein
MTESKISHARLILALASARLRLLCCLLLVGGLLGCHGWPFPSIEFDYSGLGDTPIDNAIKHDPDKFHGFPTYANDKLPNDDPLTKNIMSLLYKGEANTITAKDIEKVGASCAATQPKLCTYEGVVSYQGHNPNSQKHTLKYKVLFHLEQQPIHIEVFRTLTVSEE